MQEGVGYSQMTRNGRFRGSTARTFLRRRRRKGRANLRVETDALATRLLFDGRRCVGVAFRQRWRGPRAPRGARSDPVRRRGELAAPAANLRHRSGARTWQSIGVAVRARPARRRRQPAGPLRRRASRTGCGTRSRSTSSRAARGWPARWRGSSLRGNGALTFGVTSAQVFTRSREGLASPDLQLLFTPASYDPAPLRRAGARGGMTVAVCPVRPDSRGSIMATSPDPFAKPRDHAELPVGAERCARAAGRHAPDARDLRPGADRPAQRGGDRARPATW